METCGIIWIISNNDKVFKSMHEAIYKVLSLLFSFFKGFEMLSK
jgi:hypothetical protein